MVVVNYLIFSDPVKCWHKSVFLSVTGESAPVHVYRNSFESLFASFLIPLPQERKLFSNLDL